MTKEQDYRYYFDVPDWCPFTARLPDINLFLGTSQEYRCLSVIHDVRELASFCGGYSDSFLSTARTIFESYDSVYEHAQTVDGGIYENRSDAAYFVRSFHLGMYFDDDIPDYLIWAVFAVAEAWHSLEEILKEGLVQDPAVMKQVQDAQLLIAAATAERENELLRNIIEERNAREHQAADYLQTLDSYTQVSAANQNRFILRGEFWEVGFRGQVTYLKDTPAVRQLVRLLDNPGNEFPAVDLVATSIDDRAGRLEALNENQLYEDEGMQKSNLYIPETDTFEIGGKGHSEEAAWEGLLELQKEKYEKACLSGDQVGALQAKDQYALYLEQYKECQRTKRRGNAEAEKARANVGMNIARTIKTIKKNLPALAKHLTECVKTGVKCWYKPTDADNPHWVTKEH